MPLSAIVVCPSLQCACSIPAAEWWNSSAVGIAQIVAHSAGESIFCMWVAACSSKITLGRRCCCYYMEFLQISNWGYTCRHWTKRFSLSP